MNKLNLSKIVKSVRTAVGKHSPEILTGIGIAGMVTTAVMAVRATPKALILIENKKQDDNIETIAPIEMLKTAWSCYIPAAITGGISIACLIGASSVNVRRNTALAAAYSISESALKGYQEKVIETIGEKKGQLVRDAIAREKIEKDPVDNREVIITKNGNTLCYDVISGRYFKSDIDTIKRAVNEINKNLLNNMQVSLNDFYYEIGLDNTKIGDNLGWNMEHGLIELNYSSQLATDGTPCLVMDYQVAPRYDYYR